VTIHELPPLPPERFPNLTGAERPFLEFWWQNIVRPDDPQKLRWVECEEHQVSHASGYVDRLGLGLLLEGARVLDIGCQNGATLVALSRRGARPTGIELDPRCVEAASIRLQCHGIAPDVHAGSGCALPFDAATFDAVLASNVIEHVEDPLALVGEVKRVLRPGGIVYIDGPNRFSPKFLWSDPHYQMAGVSALPGWLSRAYVTKIRRYPSYDAETFPTASGLCRMLRQRGLAVLPALDGDRKGLPRFLHDLRINTKPVFSFLARDTRA
jgi:2-polyprenyl-3-methyl-5-hydroxy-6-metoxy-1,4-benzoquinol methylase